MKEATMRYLTIETMLCAVAVAEWLWVLMMIWR